MIPIWLKSAFGLSAFIWDPHFSSAYRSPASRRSLRWGMPNLPFFWQCCERSFCWFRWSLFCPSSWIIRCWPYFWLNQSRIFVRFVPPGPCSIIPLKSLHGRSPSRRRVKLFSVLQNLAEIGSKGFHVAYFRIAVQDQQDMTQIMACRTGFFHLL